MCREWYAQVVQTETVSFEQLNDPGPLFENYDSKIFEAGLKASPALLQRDIRRIDAELQKVGKDMSGRQVMRKILDWFATDKTSRELFDITSPDAAIPWR